MYQDWVRVVLGTQTDDTTSDGVVFRAKGLCRMKGLLGYRDLGTGCITGTFGLN